MYTILDPAMYLYDNMPSLKKKCILWYQAIAAPPNRLREFFLILLF